MSDIENIRAGQIWKAVDPRFERFIRVEVVLKTDVCIRTVVQSGGRWISTRGHRCTYASAARFNGKRGGYALHEDRSVDHNAMPGAPR